MSYSREVSKDEMIKMLADQMANMTNLSLENIATQFLNGKWSYKRDGVFVQTTEMKIIEEVKTDNRRWML